MKRQDENLNNKQLDRVEHIVDGWYKRWSIFSDKRMFEDSYAELKTLIRLERAVANKKKPISNNVVSFNMKKTKHLPQPSPETW